MRIGAVARRLAFLAVMGIAPWGVQAGPATLSLDEALDVALREGSLVRAGEASVRAAEERRGLAETGYYPSLTAAASYTRQTGNMTPRPGFLPSTVSLADPKDTSYNVYNFSLSLAQPVYDFGRTAGLNEQAGAALDAARADLAARRLATWYEVVVRYYGVLAADEMVGVAERARDQAKVHAERARSLFAAGSRPKIDVVRTEADFQSAEAALLGARDEAVVARVALLAAMGVRRSADFAPVRPPEPPESDGPATLGAGGEAAVEAAVGDALSVRPERQALLARIAGQDAAVGTLRSNLWPSLALAASFTDVGLSPGEWRYWNWAAGLTLSVPVLAVFPVLHQVREAQALSLGMRATLDATDATVRAEVLQAAARLRDARAKRVPVQAALDASREALHLAEGRDHAGTGGYVELLVAQAAAANAEASRVRARLDVATAWAAWRRALGVGADGGPTP